MKNKKIIISILVLIFFLFIVWILLLNPIIFRYKNKINLEKSIAIFENKEELPFYIDKIIFYSSAYGKNKNNNFTQKNWILELYQYTDIAIYLNTYLEDFSKINSLKKVSISDINISNPNIGNTSIYYLDSQEFGTEKYLESNKILDTLEFTVLNDSNSENLIKTNTPVLFSDLSNPITLKYVNILDSNFKLPTDEIIFFNGSLLKRANINLSDLKSTLSLKINLTNNDNENFYYNLNLTIPLYNKNFDLYSEDILIRDTNLNYKFLK